MARQNILVQMPPDFICSSALINSGFKLSGKVVSFHAYSDTMKARILELIASGVKLQVHQTSDAPRDGEWLQEPIIDDVDAGLDDD